MNVDILSPEKLIPTVVADAVSVPTVQGYMGVLPGHTALITQLEAGGLIVSTKGGQKRFFVSGGYLQIENDTIKIIADSVEAEADIDFSRAEEALKKAKERLGKFEDATDILRALDAQGRAEERLKLK